MKSDAGSQSGPAARRARSERRLRRNAGFAATCRLQIYPAEIVALVGSNGAGKTTLLRALSRVHSLHGAAWP